MSDLILAALFLSLGAYVAITIWSNRNDEHPGKCPDCNTYLDYGGSARWDCPKCGGE
jgi:tRNA(Ile2) C34 agmatinyltransferase TiaS